MLRWCLLFAMSSSLLAADLAGGIERLLATVPEGGRSAVVVYDLTKRKLLYSRNGGESFTPASVAKLITSSAALLELGPDWRFRTRLAALGAMNGDTIPGLGIDSNGDPCLDEHFSDGDPERFFRTWATQLKARGVLRIAGDIVVDRSRFKGPAKPTTWPQDHANQQSWFSAPQSAFAWNDNCVRMRVLPGTVGNACRIEVLPVSPRVVITNRTKSVNKSASNVIADRDHNGNDVTVSGTYSSRTDWLDLALHDDADLAAADHFKMVLERSGIRVDGQVVPGRVPHDARDLVVEEHTLGQAVDILNQHSLNLYGEQILRVLGWTRFGEGSTEAGCRAVGDILRQHLGKDLSGYTLVDGCGLSYSNQTCADMLARLLVYMDAHPLGPRFRASLKEMKSGTMVGQVKTGTLAIARALAGYVDRSDGSRVCFVVLINRGDARTSGWMVGLREKLFAAIAEGL